MMEPTHVIIFTQCILLTALFLVLSIKYRKIDANIRSRHLKRPYVYILIVLPTVFFGVLQIVINSGTPFVYSGIMLSIYILFTYRHPQTIIINDDDLEPALKQNEYDANSTIEILSMVAFSILTSYYFLFKTVTTISPRELYILIPEIFLWISIIISRIKSDRFFHITKYFLIITMLFIFGGFSFGYGAASPVALAVVLGLCSRYYNKLFFKIFAFISLIVSIVFGIIAYKYFGVVDLSSLSLPPGSIITIPESTWIEDGLASIDLNNPEIFRSYLMNAVLGVLLVFILLYLLFRGIQQSIHRILENTVSTAKERAILENDLEVATHIQNSMLPTNFDDFDGAGKVDIKATLFAAKEVGGDFYNFFSVDYDHVCIIVGDVSGKGIPASLFMSKAQTSFKTIGLLEIGPSLIMKFVNNIMKEGNDENFFATVWLGIITLSTGDLEFVSAGHNAPLLSHKNGEYEYMTEETDFVIGLMEDMEYTSYHRKLLPGDSILIYTDGVVDATNTQGEKYGEERLLEFMNSISQVTNKEKIDKLEKKVIDFTGSATQFDDVTIMSVLFLGDKDGI